MSDLSHKFSEARKMFPHVGKTIYFNTASYGPFCTPVAEAIKNNVDLRLSADKDDSRDAFATVKELHGMYGRLIGAPEKSIGLGLNTSFGLNLTAFGLPLKEGDEILVSDVEFPALIYVFREAAKERNLRLTYVPSKDRCFDIDAFEEAIGDRTRVLALSYVQFFNGFKNDLAELSRICREHDIYFVVDGIQGMGTEPLNVVESGIDVFSSGCQKWMLSPQGCGFFYLADSVRDQLQRTHASWLDVDWGMDFTDLFKYDMPVMNTAEKYSMGYFAILNILGMRAAARIFEDLGIDNIQQHNHAQVDRVADFVRNNDFYAITCSMEPKHRSSIFTFTCKGYEQLHRRLVKNKIICVCREGSIRISLHLFNDESDVDRLLELMDTFAKEH